MVLPTPDELAYDGNIIVKQTTYGKSRTTKASGLSKVRQAIDTLNKEADKRLTLDRIDPDSSRSVEIQVIVNKDVAAELRKVSLMLTTFLKNNS